MIENKNPKVVDNDHDEITAELAGVEIRGWSYENRDEHRVKMLAAREFCEGWYQGRLHYVRSLESAEGANLDKLSAELDQVLDSTPVVDKTGMPAHAMIHEVEAVRGRDKNVGDFYHGFKARYPRLAEMIGNVVLTQAAMAYAMLCKKLPEVYPSQVESFCDWMISQ